MQGGRSHPRVARHLLIHIKIEKKSTLRNYRNGKRCTPSKRGAPTVPLRRIVPAPLHRVPRCGTGAALLIRRPKIHILPSDRTGSHITGFTICCLPC